MQDLRDMGPYEVVVVDPPWPIRLMNWKAHHYAKKLPYPTMSLAEIEALPVAGLLAPAGWVFLWTTNGHLRNAPGVLDRWGLEYAFTMTWVKGKGPQGPNTPCFNAEYVVVGRIGKPEFADTKGFRTANQWPVAGHSEKPEGFYELLRRVTTGPRLDMFARRAIDGFDSWGMEAPENIAGGRNGQEGQT